MYRLFFPGLIAAGFLIVAFVLEPAARARAVGGQDGVTEIQSLNHMSAQFRRMLANVIFMRLDDYLHSSDVIVKRGPDGAEMTGVSVRASTPDLLPLARLVVMLDPTFVRAGIIVGGYLMKDTRLRPAGSEFLFGMIQGNPDHPRLYALYGALGIMRANQRDWQAAKPMLYKALELYPRVQDKALCERLGEPHEDPSDDFQRRHVLTMLTLTLCWLGEYEEASKYWMETGDFSPTNKVVRVVAAYRRMKSQGAVDHDELGFMMQKLSREELDNANAAAVVKDPGHPDVATAARIEMRAQESETVQLTMDEILTIKLSGVLVAIALIVLASRFTGRLSR